MKDDYRVFKKFSNIDEAKELGSVLESSNINYKVIDNSPPVDITFTGNLQNEIQILILQEDFEKATQLLENRADDILDQVASDHYLFEFTNEELFEILMKPDEWGVVDYKLSQRILKDRGQNVNDELIQALKKQRLDDLAKPEENHAFWVYFGYVFALLGGLIGLFIGWYMWTYKKSLPNGERVSAYSPQVQRHGRNIFFTGIVSLFLLVSFRIISEL
ncbi:MAG: hypothetical protein ACI8SA_002541 [Dokdonia sp.]|jgi:hypothetical protein